MSKKNIIVIGASAGGVIALVELFKSIPNDFEGYIFVVQHLSPFSPSMLPQIISRSSHLKAVHPKDGDKIKINTIYIAPPDHHLLIEKDKVMVKKGPKENRFRPSIDALFRSAAYSYGSRVVGVVLSGLLDDGTSGLWSIKRKGGTTLIQDPKDAEFPSMPLNVLEYVDVDHSIAMTEMGDLLNCITKEIATETALLSEEEMDRLKVEVNIAAQDNAFEMGVLDKGALTPLTCPECNGALVKFTEGKIVRFRCHTGHAFTDSALLAGVTKAIEENMWKTVKGLEEAIMILENTAKQFEKQGKSKVAKAFSQKAKETHHRSQHLRKQIFEQEKFSEDLRFSDKEEGSEFKIVSNSEL
ncbi:MAG TPA: chemotaxis protein CheB [Chitinophagaceae bacterium]|jgi:two-component system chemotaxis response regulator CheB|nr:chemotaxis protein CheB [Chitinophagaceae bacterium]